MPGEKRDGDEADAPDVLTEPTQSSNEESAPDPRPPAAPQQAETAPDQNTDLMQLPSVDVETSEETTLPRHLRRSRVKEPPKTSSEEIYKAIGKSKGHISWGIYIFVGLGILGLGSAAMVSSGPLTQAIYKWRPDVFGMMAPKSDLPLSKQGVGKENTATQGGSPALAPASAQEAAPEAEIAIETDVVGYEVLVNGQPAELFNHRFVAPAGEPRIVIRRLGFEDYLHNGVIEEGRLNVIRPDFRQERRRGFLTFETIPAAKLSLFQDGQLVIELDTPVEGASVPVGKYRAVLENSLIGYRSEEELEVHEWATTSVRRQLR
jgi:hypothetical protein